MALVSQAHIAKLNESELFRDSVGMQSMVAQDTLDYIYLESVRAWFLNSRVEPDSDSLELLGVIDEVLAEVRA